MKILEKSGIYQMEDWSGEEQRGRYVIGCYPQVTKKPDGDYWHKVGRRIRISIVCEGLEEMKEAFVALTEGRKTILDYKEAFHDQKKAQYIG